MDAQARKAKCGTCGKAVHFYKAVIGGKRYGDCACEGEHLRTWIMDASSARFVNHCGAPIPHDAKCSCDYCKKGLRRPRQPARTHAQP